MKTMILLLHFCAEFKIPDTGQMHVFDGTVEFEGDPFAHGFIENTRKIIAEAMEPPRPAKDVVIRSLTTIARR